ncbi:hypothetical protein IPM09_02930 [Candidatus Saccharibacteria bacterium]|nr:MAG: hypothetical protein IPM09_02930 [Candidatus Saccharibacteria bacterium]
MKRPRASRVWEARGRGEGLRLGGRAGPRQITVPEVIVDPVAADAAVVVRAQKWRAVDIECAPADVIRVGGDRRAGRTTPGGAGGQAAKGSDENDRDHCDTTTHYHTLFHLVRTERLLHVLNSIIVQIINKVNSWLMSYVMSEYFYELLTDVNVVERWPTRICHVV